MGCQLDIGKYRGACPRGMNHILRSIRAGIDAIRDTQFDR
jgi:hypothetical protein